MSPTCRLTDATMKTAFRAAVGASVFTLVANGGLEMNAQRRSVWDGIFTEEQATRGKAVYEQHCRSCHGADLMGDGVMDPSLAIGSSPDGARATSTRSLQRCRRQCRCPDAQHQFE